MVASWSRTHERTNSLKFWAKSWEISDFMFPYAMLTLYKREDAGSMCPGPMCPRPKIRGNLGRFGDGMFFPWLVGPRLKSLAFYAPLMFDPMDVTPWTHVSQMYAMRPWAKAPLIMNTRMLGPCFMYKPARSVRSCLASCSLWEEGKSERLFLSL